MFKAGSHVERCFPHDMDEANIIEGLTQGSAAAFDKAYRLYAGRLYAFCLKFCKSRQEAEEIVNDVFVRLWLARGTIHHDKSLKPLPFTISRRFLTNAYRHRVNSPVYASYLEAVTRDVGGGQEADRQVEYDDFARKLQVAIDRLPPTQRKVVRLSKFEGMSNKEITAALGLSEQTVKNQLSLALKQLRKELPLLVFFIFFAH